MLKSWVCLETARSDVIGQIAAAFAHCFCKTLWETSLDHGQIALIQVDYGQVSRLDHGPIVAVRDDGAVAVLEESGFFESDLSRSYCHLI